MKKHAIIIVMLFTCIMYSQTKKNGTIYSDHPAIDVVEAMQQAFVAGDTVKVANYLADNFTFISGMNTDPDAKGGSKENFINRAKGWNNNIDYFSMSRTEGAYPDALIYADNKDAVWVQTWDNIQGVHKGTGVKIDMPIHRLYVVNKDNKIVRCINYDDGAVWAKLRQTRGTRTNGVLYNQHKNINTVRKMVAALEHGDSENAFKYFTDDARFTNLDMARDEWNSVEKEKANFDKMLESWDIVSIDQVGYPDYLEYELGNAKVVQSWWDFKVKRKSDGKKVNIPVMLTHDFNDEGEITNENGYYTVAAMMK